MGIKVTYNVTFKEKDAKERIIDANNVIQTIKRDVSWGTFTPDLDAVDQTLNSQNNGRNFEPKALYDKKSNKLIFDFQSEHFDFVNEGINHFLSTIAGDIIRNADVIDMDIEDIEFDSKSLGYFKGPKVGITGLRELILRNTLRNEKRPIIAYSIKPRMGITPDAYEKIIEGAAASGVDIIEEDERLVDPKYCPFAERLKSIQRVKERTKSESVFSVNLSGLSNNLKDRAIQAYRSGVRLFKMDVLSVGFDTLIQLRDIIDSNEFAEPVGITVFPDIHGKLYRGISRQSILKLSRLCGADILYAGSPNLSRMGSIEVDDWQQDINKLHSIHKMLSSEINNVKATLPTITHDVHPGVLEKIVYSFRILEAEHTDYAFFIGGGISGFPTIKKGVQEACEIWMDLIRYASSNNLKKHNDLSNIEEIVAFNLEKYEYALRKKGWDNALFKQKAKKNRR